MQPKPLNLSDTKPLKLQHSNTGVNKQYTKTRDQQTVFQSPLAINIRTNVYCNMKARKCLEGSNTGRTRLIETLKQTLTLYG